MAESEIPKSSKQGVLGSSGEAGRLFLADLGVRGSFLGVFRGVLIYELGVAAAASEVKGRDFLPEFMIAEDGKGGGRTNELFRDEEGSVSSISCCSSRTSWYCSSSLAAVLASSTASL